MIPEVHSDIEHVHPLVVQVLHVTAAKDAVEKRKNSNKNEESAANFFMNMLSSSKLLILTKL